MTHTTLFIITGIAMTLIVGLFMSLLLTSGMRDGWKRNVITVILALVIGFTIGGLLTLEHIGDEEKWNNGYCACGGSWELFDIEKSRSNSSTKYYFTCDECQSLIQTNTYFR
jgi:hypothetical protein